MCDTCEGSGSFEDKGECQDGRCCMLVPQARLLVVQRKIVCVLALCSAVPVTVYAFTDRQALLVV